METPCFNVNYFKISNIRFKMAPFDDTLKASYLSFGQAKHTWHKYQTWYYILLQSLNISSQFETYNITKLYVGKYLQKFSLFQYSDRWFFFKHSPVCDKFFGARSNCFNLQYLAVLGSWVFTIKWYFDI